MSLLYKHARAAEFCALAKRLVGAEGRPVSQAELARRLNVSTASVSKYISGEQNPEPSKIELLRRLVADVEGGQMEEAPVSMDEQMKFLEASAPAAAELARGLVTTIYRNELRKLPPTTQDVSTASLAKHGAGKVFEAAEAAQSEASGRSHKAALPSGKTDGPKTRGPRHPTGTQTPQGPAPK